MTYVPLTDRTPIRFDQIDDKDLVDLDYPGVYEIVLDDGTPLKVGRTLKNRSLRNRLKDHKRSHYDNSVLARHLAGKATRISAEHEIATPYDLTDQTGRRAFLRNTCQIYYLRVKDVNRRKVLEEKREAAFPWICIDSVDE